ncbi:MAG TPA: HemK/PrmC family methyltransferase, partial [Bacteroidia bacterium]|nr:HemK/PrmC family methyltransferase [Bacteroidia bacterium]
SGCIAIELSLLFPKALVKATDISAEAINVAIKNASDLGASVTFVNESVFDSGTETLQSKVDIIVSNPPYIAQHEAKEMHPNVLKWEPHTALFVKEHPLEFYITIAALATKILNENGYVFLELNPTYANQIAQCFKDKGFNQVEIIKDISGKERFLKVQ